ncbi:MAG: hypothetical protein NZ455_12575 [Bacteroidia bacterium]|nr:hypothetical protein [Bacteroidia bacterium]MDW8347369.1 hypothetical protein [Bacteroidia bacterium]
MRRVREQCVAQRSTAAKAQPAARRPERKRGTRPKNLSYFNSKTVDCKVRISYKLTPTPHKA